MCVGVVHNRKKVVKKLLLKAKKEREKYKKLSLIPAFFGNLN